MHDSTLPTVLPMSTQVLSHFFRPSASPFRRSSFQTVGRIPLSARSAVGDPGFH